MRPFNTYGPRQSARAVIPTIISQIYSGKKEIYLGKITPTRDFNYVFDTCEAFKAVAFSKKTIGRIINSASNYEISIKDTALLISDLMNIEINIKSEESRLRPENSEVNRLFGDNKLLRELTNWEPQYGGLDGFKRGLKLTIEWFSKKENISLYKTEGYSI